MLRSHEIKFQVHLSTAPPTVPAANVDPVNQWQTWKITNSNVKQQLDTTLAAIHGTCITRNFTSLFGAWALQSGWMPNSRPMKTQTCWLITALCNSPWSASKLHSTKSHKALNACCYFRFLECLFHRFFLSNLFDSTFFQLPPGGQLETCHLQWQCVAFWQPLYSTS